MRKVYFSMMALALAMSACTSDEIAYESSPVTNAAEQPISFSVRTKNMTRATAMEDLGLYNFGVDAYKKKTDGTYETVMKDYLVGYHADPTGTPAVGKGYALTGTEKTYGPSNSLTDGISQWFYEGLGKDEYTYTGTEGYYKKTETGYMSKNDKQYLKYWDYSAQQMDFYAYAPYGKGTITRATDGSTVTVNFGEVTGGTTLADYMVAEPVTRKPNDASPKYNDDIPFTFKRMMGKVRLVFYDDVTGYDVEINNVDETDPVNPVGVKAEPATTSGIVTKLDGVSYEYISGTTTIGTPTKSNEAINFEKPVGAPTGKCNKIQETRPLALATASSQSPTFYYCVPCGFDPTADPKVYVNDALVFHISFTLYSLDTDEKIQVKDATVTIPADYTQWTANTLYTYIFKITQNNNGSTGDDDDPKGLYPIVFDDIQVAYFTSPEEQSEWVVSQVSLSEQLITLSSSSKDIVANMNYVDKNGISYAFTWSSSNTDVVTVAETTAATAATMTSVATITAVAAGTATITATNNGTTASCTVTVPLTLSDMSLAVGATPAAPTNNLPAVTVPATWSAAWTSSNMDVATVNTSGVVTAVAAGTSEIKLVYTDATGREQTQTCVVTVPLTVTDLTLAVSITATPINNMPTIADPATVTWSISDGGHATINAETGEVTAVSAGTETVTLTYKDARGVTQTQTCVVIVS